MAKLVYCLWFLLCAMVIQVHSLEIGNGFDNRTEIESDEEVRFLFNGLAAQCRARINKVSTIVPGLKVTLTRLSNNRLYYFSPAVPAGVRISFDNANRFCREHGMNLVTINSEKENELVYSEAAARGLTGIAAAPGAWIGLQDATATGIYRWILNGLIDTLNYFNAPPGVGLCVAYKKAIVTPANSWADLPCGDPLAFICELEAPCGAIL